MIKVEYVASMDRYKVYQYDESKNVEYIKYLTLDEVMCLISTEE